MRCQNCGTHNSDDNKYCINCGQPLEGAAASAPGGVIWTEKLLPKRRRALAVSIAVSVVLLAVLVLVLVLTASPVAGRWYAQDGTQLILLRNGKGMTVTDASGESGRIHFMYAVGYREPGYVEGQIYETRHADGAWFYLLDGVLEFDGKYYYRQKPSGTAR
jgi:hypothetical protein